MRPLLLPALLACLAAALAAGEPPPEVRAALEPLAGVEPAAVLAALERAPDHALVRLARAQALHRLERRREAVAAYRGALELDRGLGAAWRGLALLAVAEGRWGEALAACGAAFDPGTAEAGDLALWIRAAQEAEDLPLAERLLDRAVPRFPGDRTLRRLEARHLVQAGRRAEAQAAVRALLRQEPGDAALWTTLAGLAQEAGDVDGALAALEAAWLAAPEAEALRRLAGQELAHGRAASAWARLRTAPEPAARRLAAQAAGACGEPAAGRERLAPLLAAPDPGGDGAGEAGRRQDRLLDARLAVQAGDPADALAVLDRLAGEADPQVLTWAGSLAETLGRLPDAEARYAAALAAAPDHAPAQLRLAALLARTHRPAEARTLVAARLAKEPADAAAQAMAARLDALLGAKGP